MCSSSSDDLLDSAIGSDGSNTPDDLSRQLKFSLLHHELCDASWWMGESYGR
jgi:hypothetical protein